MGNGKQVIPGALQYSSWRVKNEPYYCTTNPAGMEHCVETTARGFAAMRSVLVLSAYAYQKAGSSVLAVHVGEATTTTLALVVHELATNSIKYGALSRAGGTIDVSCTVQDGEVVVTWKEKGGPVIDAAKRSEGFGTKLVTRSVCGQLGGSIAFDWPGEGVVVTLRMDEARMAR